MLRITQNSAPQGAKSYYSTSDYYTEGQELTGVWRGEAAARLGLEGNVQQKDWDALCDNRDPGTGKTLTARQKANRRVGYDFNFHVPKSVSLLYGLTGDERIVETFREAVEATMRDMEAEMQTRVRSGGRDEDRITGNMVFGEFVHFTARPVDGVPDPHLHAHCFVFNTTWDAAESRWKAGQFAGLKRDAPFFEAVFHSRLARGLEELGLPVERTRKGWEIEGVPTSALRRFSRRTELIEEKAREQGITDPKAKGELGAKTRGRKRKDLTMDELRAEWRARLSDEERDAIESVAARVGGEGRREDAEAGKRSVELALSHCFERRSVAPERTVLAEALKRSVGRATPESVAAAFAGQDLIAADRDGQRLVTSDAVLDEEARMVAFAREGRGACRPLGGAPHAVRREWLNDSQRRAVGHVLASRDRVVLVRGAAGTGKTAMMQEAVEAIEAEGKRVFTFAPSADASRGVLRAEGFANADTVARLLLDERMQSDIAGQVIWVDEAGLLGARTTAELFGLAERVGARVVLSGDKRQHGSVERGATLKLLETEAGLVPAELKEIQRQKGEYKEAVEALSEGRAAEGLRRLDALGWIREVDDGDRYRALARDYVATTGAGKTALVVSPTHLEGDWITAEIRRELKAAGRLRADERPFLSLENAGLTEAERADAVNYAPGDVLVFHQNAKGITRGERIAAGGQPLPLGEASKFQVYHSRALALAPGDLVRITRNGTTLGGKHRLNNGAVYSVKGFTRRGDLALANGWVVAKDFGHLAYGYVVTSHASQGKTVDRVLIGQSSASMRAGSREQFYVSVSRGRQQATIYTDDKDALLLAVSQHDERLSATELAAEAAKRGRVADAQRLAGLEAVRDRGAEHERAALDHVR
jgi:conjugative relaxase-like TrwC/TraI family protein